MNPHPWILNCQAAEFTVTTAPPEIRKATASSSLRPIEVDNGMTVQAPAFIKEGDRIKVNTDTGEYIEKELSSV